MFRYLASAGESGPAHADALRALRRPLRCAVLVLYAGEDHALGRRLLRGTERYAPALELHVLEGCSHWVQQDRPEQVNELVRAFLLRGAEHVAAGAVGAREPSSPLHDLPAQPQPSPCATPRPSECAAAVRQR